MSKKKSVTEDNTAKAVEGNNYQTSICSKINKLDYIMYARSNVTHIYNREKKLVDIECQIKDKDYIICMELSTSSRDDRMGGKQYHANFTKKAIETEGNKCLYLYLCPHDKYYEEMGKEIPKNIANNNRCIKKVNHRFGIQYIDFAIKDDEMEEILSLLHDSKSNNPKYLANKIRNYLCSEQI